MQAIRSAFIVLILGNCAIGQTPAEQTAMNAVAGEAQPANSADVQKLNEMTDAALLKEKTQATEEIAQISTMLSTASRNFDPFGLPVTGDFLAIQSETPQSSEVASESVPLFVQAVQALKIVGLNLDARAFFVGSRVIREGDVVTLSFKGQRFTLSVESVGVNLVVFKDSQTGQQAVSRPRIVPNMNPPELQPMNPAGAY